MKKKVLIVEDEKVLQDAYKIILSSQGYDVTTADNGLEAISRIKQSEPDIVLLDVFMPIMNGREFLENVDLNTYPQTKIIVYSNLSDSDVEKSMIELGAETFVLKSEMNPADLIELVARYANNQ